MNHDNPWQDARPYLHQLVILVAGFVLGLAAAEWISSIPMDATAGLERARSLGITSLTTLTKYAKKRDLVMYFATLVLPVVLSTGLWLLWARRWQEELRKWYDVEETVDSAHRGRWWIALSAVAIFYAWASFNATFLHAPAWNDYVGAWVLLGEEGENLAWVQYLLDGGVFGKDFFCLYGPLLIYPLVWLMKIVGPSILVERLLRYFFDLTAYAIVITFLYRTCRWKPTFIAFAVIHFILFPTFQTLSINFTYLRFALGVLPLLLLYEYLKSRSRKLIIGAGIALACSLLFSQEAGFAALLAVIGGLALELLRHRDMRLGARDYVSLSLGLVGALLPFILYLAVQGALPAFWQSIYGFPRLTMLGYGARPAPQLGEFLSSSPSSSLQFFWVIFLYSSAGVFVLKRFFQGRLSADNILIATLCAFGAILFMVAVRRYSIENVSKIWLPAILLTFLLFERSVQLIVRRCVPNVLGAGAMALALVISGTLVVVLAPHPRALLSSVMSCNFDLATKWTIRQPVHPPAVRLPEIERTGGIMLDAQSANHLRALHGFLKNQTKADEPVYFFPNEAAYSFLLERTNPTRYAMSYFAITSAQRAELIESLEQVKPRFIFYNKKTWRIDGIPEHIQVPEVVDYIVRNYVEVADLDGITVLTRGASGTSSGKTPQLGSQIDRQ